MGRLAGIAPNGTGRVRWRRFVITLVPGLALAVMLILLSTQAVLAVSISISGAPFTVTAGMLKGYGFEQFPVVDHTAAKGSSGRPKRLLLESTAIRRATISHLCESVRAGLFSLVITAGNGSTPVTATDLVVDANRFSGNVTFTHLTQGVAANALNRVPGVTGSAGAFALQASKVTITNLRQHAYATTAGTFTLPGLSFHLGGSC
jgi:Family of unknown function (DUF6230)